MGAFSAQISNRAGSRPLLVTLFALLALPACDEKEAETDLPTEPWLKDDAERKRADAPARLRYQLEPGASLSISLPTRKSKPTGRLTRIRGYVEFDLKELAFSRGRVVVELDSLEMNDLPRPEKSELEEETPELYTAATKEALRWLGLGERVTGEERQKHRLAVFEFDSLRTLSHPSAHTGALRKSKSAGRARQVYATADGTLELGGLAVRRAFPTTLLFQFPDTESKVPASVDVTLRSGVNIPLEEYDIVPRGPDGHENTKRRDLVGRLVGSQARVTGTLSFRRPEAFPPSETTEKP